VAGFQPASQLFVYLIKSPNLGDSCESKSLQDRNPF
jgi:hypothetical protein